MLNWLLIFVPLAAGLEFFAPEWHIAIFATAALAIIPLAGWLGDATEHLAHRAGAGIGALLNVTFGNAAELILAGVALRAGLYPVVKSSLTGSILGNILFVLGAAVLAGGLRHKEQTFNTTAAREQATLLTLAAISMVMPASFHALAGGVARVGEHSLSMVIAALLLFTYVAHLFFSLHTHKQLFAEETAPPAEAEKPWSLRKSILILLAATALIAGMSEILVGSVEPAAKALGMTRVFVGIVIIAIVGNAAEHSTAVMMALKNRMELSLGIAIGSSLQIALFVAPVLVILSRFIGPRPMDLVFTPAEVVAVFVAVLITGQIASDGKSNWLEGVQLLVVYLIIAMVFFFLPESAATE
jgi:Ca2+:H+ antiporter